MVSDTRKSNYDRMQFTHENRMKLSNADEGQYNHWMHKSIIDALWWVNLTRLVIGCRYSCTKPRSFSNQKGLLQCCISELWHSQVHVIVTYLIDECIFWAIHEKDAHGAYDWSASTRLCSSHSECMWNTTLKLSRVAVESHKTPAGFIVTQDSSNA